MGWAARGCFHAAVVGLTLASASLGGCAEAQQTLARATAGDDTRRRTADACSISDLRSIPNPGPRTTSSSWRICWDTRARYRVVPMIASNVTSGARLYPIADDATIAALVGTAATQAGPDDIVFVDISSHGASQVLARKVGNHAPTALSSRELARKLEPLVGHPTVIIISACYSGSLIGDLRAPERIIITAARADRSSFGCAPDNRHTFFGEAELHAFGQQNRSLHQAFATIRDDVARMELGKRYQPSEPQVWVGANMTRICTTRHYSKLSAQRAEEGPRPPPPAPRAAPSRRNGRRAASRSSAGCRYRSAPPASAAGAGSRAGTRRSPWARRPCRPPGSARAGACARNTGRTTSRSRR